MKKIIYSLASLLIITSCSTDRDSIESKNEIGQVLSKGSSDDPLCLVTEESTILYGNSSDYPQIGTSYYNFIPKPGKESVQSFFVKAKLSMDFYISNKYYQGNSFSLKMALNSNELSDMGTYGIDYEAITNTVNNYEQGTNHQMIPGNNLTLEVGSYVLYRILSYMDYYINYYYSVNGITLKPIGIAFNYNKTICGDYIGLSYKIYYSLN